MAQPQAGIIPEPNPFAVFLILRVHEPAVNGSAVTKIAAQVPALVKKVSAADSRAKLVCNVSFGCEFWDVISPGKRPVNLRPFRPIEWKGRRAPSTDGDLLFHIISKRHDLNLELAMRLRNLLGDMVEVMDEVHGFRYLDTRDLTGFIDGTENPTRGSGPDRKRGP